MPAGGREACMGLLAGGGRGPRNYEQSCLQHFTGVLHMLLHLILKTVLNSEINLPIRKLEIREVK